MLPCHARQILENPMQQWSNVRAEFSSQLRQPLCLALLKNCTSPYDEVYALATRLFTAIILQACPWPLHRLLLCSDSTMRPPS